jgi:hypothetical protein
MLGSESGPSASHPIADVYRPILIDGFVPTLSSVDVRFAPKETCHDASTNGVLRPLPPGVLRRRWLARKPTLVQVR